MDVAIDPRKLIQVELANRSAEPIAVLWDECAYIDVDKRSHRIQVLAQSPAAGASRSVIAPGTRMRELLVPVGSPLDSSFDPFLPARKPPRWWWPFGGSSAGTRLGAAVPSRHPLIGKEIGVFLVLERGGERKSLLAPYAIERAPRT